MANEIRLTSLVISFNEAMRPYHGAKRGDNMRDAKKLIQRLMEDKFNNRENPDTWFEKMTEKKNEMVGFRKAKDPYKKFNQENVKSWFASYGIDVDEIQRTVQKNVLIAGAGIVSEQPSRRRSI
jgi:hypothetical protein